MSQSYDQTGQKRLIMVRGSQRHSHVSKKKRRVNCMITDINENLVLVHNTISKYHCTIHLKPSLIQKHFDYFDLLMRSMVWVIIRCLQSVLINFSIPAFTLLERVDPFVDDNYFL
ncbi:hypothetical protein BC833DRAFT_662817 [Globomyces pollinis-pini]|nr:hypothetical protein BC833DRAFT_662817 [Globomyces pollinis-pini]